MTTSTKLDNDLVGKDVNIKMYTSAIGSLLYLTDSRLDILFIIRMYAMYQYCTKKSHLEAFKRILKYLKETQNIGL